MNSMKDILTEVFGFARTYNLDPVELLLESADSNESNNETSDDKPVSQKGPPESSLTANPVIPPLAEPVQPDGLHYTEVVDLCKRYWLSRPLGFTATAEEVFAHCGFKMPCKAKALASWLKRNP